MIPYFSYSQISIGPVTIYTWGFCLGFSFLIGYWLALKELTKQGIRERKVFYFCLWIFVGAMLGARIGTSGLMFYSGFFGALIAGWLYLKKNNLNFLPIADKLSPVIALGIFITRIGCFLINDHQGAVTNLPWAIQWPDATLRHPVALYLSLNALILFFVLQFLKNKLKNPGQLFLVFLTYYSISRFFLDFTRAISTLLSDPHYWGLTISQWISLGILITLGLIIIYEKAYLKNQKS